MLDNKPRDPSSVIEALSHHDAADWQAAIVSELQSLKQTWNMGSGGTFVRHECSVYKIRFLSKV